MFITRKRHLRELEELTRDYNNSLDRLQDNAARIKALESHVSDLRQLVFPRTNQEISKEEREVDAVLGGSDKASSMSEEELTKILAGQRELDLLISGNYSEDLLN